MKFKKVIPYILAVSMFLSADIVTSRDTRNLENLKNDDFKHKYGLSTSIKAHYEFIKNKAQNKAEQLITTYIDNAVSGAERIIEYKKKKGYYAAVQKELPGAPSSAAHGTLHCLYGQYTQLNRALAEMGDTIQIIPKTNNAHMATSSFKSQMTKLYDNENYPDAIYRGHLYSTESEYNDALNKYLTLKTKNKTSNQDSLRTHYTKEFEKNNYCANQLNPGTIIIVSSGHAIMYLGQGIIENNQFIPDNNGQAICCAYNAEQPATRLSTWNTYNSFAADIQNIMTQKYYAQMIHSQH